MYNTPSQVLPTEEVSHEIVELGAALEGLSPEVQRILSPIYQRVLESGQRRRRILNLVQDALGQLRLDMKYLLFDLEATRRERDDYLHQLENN